MRIYLTSHKNRGLGHYRPFLDWIKKEVIAGNIPERNDRNNRPFVFVDDLLPYKGKLIKNGHWADHLSLATFLTHGVVAFDVVKDMSQEILQHPDLFDNVYGKYLTSQFPTVGYVYSYNKKIAPILNKYGLGDWL